MNVHPAAAVFPMLPDDELETLAEDIRANGLIHPIVVTPSGEVLDGRNRLAACELAGVESTFVVHEGDPIAYVLSANSHRRHLTKGQRAMAGVLALGKSFTTDRDAAGQIGVTHPMVVWARTVVEYAPGLIDAVLRPQQPMALKDAYDRAAKLRDVAADPLTRLAKLREADPELAALVDSQQLELADAEAVHAERTKRSADQRRDARALLTRILDLVAPEQLSLDFVESWADHLGDIEPGLTVRIDAAIDVLTDLAKRVRA